MKLNKLFLLLLALPLAFVACEPNEPIETPTDPAVLTLTSENSLHYTPEGGQGVITYTLENAVEGTELTATTNADWITDITVGEQITFVVAANETTETRNDRILVSYGTENFNVFVTQEGIEPVIRFEAKKLDGEYYGTKYSPNHNFAIYLSDKGFEDGRHVVPNATYYALDLYVDDQPYIDENGIMTIPAGTYTFDVNDSYKDKSIGYSYSEYMKINADATAYEIKEYFESAELVITENTITLTAYVAGVKHIVTYTGKLQFYSGVPVVIEDSEIEAVDFYGEYYSMYGEHNYFVMLTDKGWTSSGGALADAYYFTLDLYATAPTYDDEGWIVVPAGTYKLDTDNTMNPWTIGYDYSGGYKVNADCTAYDWNEAFQEATMIVNKDSVRLECKISDATFVVVYNGVPRF